MYSVQITPPKTKVTYNEQVTRVEATASTCQYCFDCCFKNTNRCTRNFFRVTITGGLACLGGLVSSDPRIAVCVGISAIGASWLGSIFSGCANGMSTWFSWETNSDDRLAALEERVKALENRV